MTTIKLACMNSYKCAVLVCPVFQVTARDLGLCSMSISVRTEALVCWSSSWFKGMFATNVLILLWEWNGN